MFCISSRRVLAASAAALLTTGCARHYHATGTVLAVNPAARSVTISHRAIPGYMPAMAMEFHATQAAELAPLTPGARVRFDLSVRKQSARITTIRRYAAPSPDFVVPAMPSKVSVGEQIPDFRLVDEQNRPTHLSDFSGRLTAIEFIYTRCPLPDVCPRLSANFAYLQKRFRGEMTLLSITIDPEHDTPQVLREYAHRWRADPDTWHFLTGAPDSIRRAAESFGLFYFAEEGSITHTSATALVGPDGRLIAIMEGSSYTVKELADLVGGNIARRSQR
jgi:protein SCO1/2